MPEIRKAIESARRSRLRTLLFIDEIHRLNKAQQDALLPHVEAGAVTLIGATTENPSFSVIAPCSPAAASSPSKRSAPRPRSGPRPGPRGRRTRPRRSGITLSEDARKSLILASQGDARRLLGMLDASATIHLSSGRRAEPLSDETVSEAVGRIGLRHDRDGEEHFNVVSAMIKSLRASDPDAAIHYLARMLEAGEDPRYVARRLVIFASEDVGNADPSALGLAVSAHQAVEKIGMPEARIPLAQAATYLACAPKSNAAYLALGAAIADLEGQGPLPVPMHLRNAPTGLMKELGYGEDYVYAHEAEDGFVAAENLPTGSRGTPLLRAEGSRRRDRDRRTRAPGARGAKKSVRRAPRAQPDRPPAGPRLFPAARLRPTEYGIGRADERLWRRHLGTEARHPDRKRHPQRLACRIDEARLLDGGAPALGEDFAPEISFWASTTRISPAVAARDVGVPKIVEQHRRDPAQRRIAGEMAVVVVQPLKWSMSPTRIVSGLA